MPATAKRIQVYSNPVEQDLVSGLRNADGESFERLARQYGAQILNVANHIVRNDADAQDCVQEAFLKVLKHIDQFEGRASVGSWLHKIVANTALMRLRSQVRKKEDSLSELLPEFNAGGNRVKTDPLMPGPSVQESLQSAQTQTIVRQAITSYLNPIGQCSSPGTLKVLIPMRPPRFSTFSQGR